MIQRMSSATWLDGFAAGAVERYGYRFTLASEEADRAVAYRVRFLAAAHEGWLDAERADGLEHDRYDEGAVAVIGWDGETPVAAGRLVLPPGPLPTEEICGIHIEPRGEVVDVGRMAVVPSHQSHRHAAFIALLARLYLEMRSRGYQVASGVMSARARTLLRQLGVEVEVLAPERPYWGELRAPVRFSVAESAAPLERRWLR
jgi:GNAT superfamily N-acetyltransferase